MIEHRRSRTGVGQRSPRSRSSKLVGAAGEVFLTIALILSLYLAYTLWWTNIGAKHKAESTARAIRTEWERAEKDERQPTGSVPGIGFLHIPALGRTGEIAIVEGTDPERLNEGVAGYYTQPFKSAMPWEKEGNFALAAHRDGHGAKFHDLDRVKVGDVVVVETNKEWYVYTVFATLPKTGEGNIGVIQPIPEGSGRHTRGQYITLTTCTPVFTSDYRLIVWGELTRVEQVDSQRTPLPELSKA